MKKLRLIALMGMMLSPALLLVSKPAVELAADPFLGKWLLDVKHSKYAAGLCPAQMTIEMSAADHGTHYHSKTVWSNGSASDADYTSYYDGQPVMVRGNRGMLLPVSLKRLGPNEVMATYIRGLQTVAISRRVLSSNGRVMTVTTTSWDESGKVLTNVGVYKRADSGASRQAVEEISKTKLTSDD